MSNTPVKSQPSWDLVLFRVHIKNEELGVRKTYTTYFLLQPLTLGVLWFSPLVSQVSTRFNNNTLVQKNPRSSSLFKPTKLQEGHTWIANTFLNVAAIILLATPVTPKHVLKTCQDASVVLLRV